jgi:hypothetical protein
MASSFDFTWNIQKPASRSFVMRKGPSITVRSSPENFTRAPLELGRSPSAASSSSSGRPPASEFLSALTSTMNRIVVGPFWLAAGLPVGLDLG